MFTYETVIRLQHTDAAGVIFYARLFDLMHLAYEELLDRIDQPLPSDLARAGVGYPIVHAEAHYRQPMRLGDQVSVRIYVLEVRAHSFMLEYRFCLPDGRVAAKARTAHAAVDSRGNKTNLPNELKSALRDVQAERVAV